jgi:hypothetical protein
MFSVDVLLICILRAVYQFRMVFLRDSFVEQSVMIAEVRVDHSVCWVYVWEVYHHIFHTLLILTLRVAVQIHQFCIVETQFYN